MELKSDPPVSKKGIGGKDWDMRPHHQEASEKLLPEALTHGNSRRDDLQADRVSSRSAIAAALIPLGARGGLAGVLS